VLLKIVGNELFLVGVDGFRLSERRLLLEQPFDMPMVVIPSKTLAEIARLVGGSEEKLTLSIAPDKNLAVFKSGSKFTIFARLLEGEFPDYARIIPSDSKGRLIVDKTELINAVRLSNLFARDISNILKVTLDPATSTLTLAAATAEVGESTHTIPAEITGEGLQISFNGKYLLDLLNNVDGEKLTLETSGPLSPGLWRVVDRPDFLHLIMPVKTAS
jgi:DNA polymerase-3 subunit beta